MLDGWLTELGGGYIWSNRIRAPAVPTAAAPAEIAPGADQELRDIVRELIVVLSRKSIVGDVRSDGHDAKTLEVIGFGSR